MMDLILVWVVQGKYHCWGLGMVLYSWHRWVSSLKILVSSVVGVSFVVYLLGVQSLCTSVWKVVNRVWDDLEARRGAELGPCHPNLVVARILSQMIQSLSIRLLRRCMDLGFGSVAVILLRDSGVWWLRFLVGDIHLLFYPLVGLLHNGGGSVSLRNMRTVMWLIHQLIDKVARVGILDLAFEGLVD